MTAPFLLTAKQAAEHLGVSERTFHSLRREPWFPLPVSLGERTIRWARPELEQAVLGNAPRGNGQEPVQAMAARRRKSVTRTPNLLHSAPAHKAGEFPA